MKILFISSRYAGGIGGHASILADQLLQHGHDVTKMQVPHIPIKNLKNPSFALFGTIKAMLNHTHYDIVHGFNIPSAFVMKYIRAKKKILSVHGVYGEQVRIMHSRITSRIASNAEIRALKLADWLTTDSKKNRDRYGEYGFNFEYLPSAIDSKMFDAIPDVTKLERQVIYVGRDSFEKGIDILQNIEPDIHGNVTYCTDMKWKDAMRKMKESTVLVVPSRMESLPSVIREAFFLKVPVIAANVGGISEMVHDKKTGFLVKHDQLLDTINHILDNPDVAGSVIDNAYNFVINNMTWKVVIQKYLAMYEKLLR